MIEILGFCIAGKHAKKKSQSQRRMAYQSEVTNSSIVDFRVMREIELVVDDLSCVLSIRDYGTFCIVNSNGVGK